MINDPDQRAEFETDVAAPRTELGVVDETRTDAAAAASLQSGACRSARVAPRCRQPLDADIHTSRLTAEHDVAGVAARAGH